MITSCVTYHGAALDVHPRVRGLDLWLTSSMRGLSVSWRAIRTQGFRYHRLGATSAKKVLDSLPQHL